MKMILAIINYDDSHNVMQNLMKNGFSITKLATTGGFLKTGNVTILIGVENNKVDEAIDLIKKYSQSRKQIIPTTAELGVGFYPTMPVEVTVGGATVFVLDVEQFQKV